MGTVNLLDAVRRNAGVRVLVNVTSDKCYDNREWEWGYRESEPMGGHDPYSNSKGCAELVTDAYRRSFFSDPDGPRVASARAGNVIGGGDWAEDRLVPDLMRAALTGEPLRVRNPEAIRPWQHVLNPLSGYLRLAQALWESARPCVGMELRPSRRGCPAGRLDRGAPVRAVGGRFACQPRPGPAPARGALPEARLLARARPPRLAPDMGSGVRFEGARRLVRGRARRRRHAGGHVRADPRVPIPSLDVTETACRFCGAPSRGGFRRPRHVAACQLLSAARARQRDGAVLPAARPGLRAAAFWFSWRSSRRPSTSSPTTPTSLHIPPAGWSTRRAIPS